MTSLESAFIKPQDRDLPRLRRISRGSEAVKEARDELKLVRSHRRKLAFSSDNEHDDDDITDDRRVYATENVGQHNDDETAASNYDAGTEFEYNMDLDNDLDERERSVSVKRESSEELAPAPKRKRGRPRKGEQEKKEREVTRRSKRIVENPSLKKSLVLEPTTQSQLPKPLRAIGLVPHVGHPPELAAVSLSKKPNGKQKPLTIDAERLHTSSTRDRRFNLTTLDVLKQFVDEHGVKPASNDTINENVVLTEFKAHLMYHLNHLMDLHASIVDISHDIGDVQRRKNEMRRKILDLKKQHTAVGTELSKERKFYNDTKDEHSRFMLMVGSLNNLKASMSGGKCNLSEKVFSEIGDLAHIFDPKRGLASQLRIVNSELASLLERSQ